MVNQSDTLISARSLTRHYGNVVALDSADFTVGPGITGLLGENGAGKSTAIKIFLGLLSPTSGRAEVLGSDPRRDVEIRERLGYSPEHDCLPLNVSGADFLTHMAQVSGLPPNHARSRAADTLRHVGLFEERYRPIKEYSTGMKQRIKLAQCLVHDPLLILLDEPTAGLDPGGREEMLDLVRKTYAEFGISIVLSSHLMNDVERTADSIIVLSEGRVVEEGRVSSFTTETESIYVEIDEMHKEFIAALNSRGVASSNEGSTVVIRDVADDGYDMIRDALAESGAPVRRLGPRRHSLREVFTDGEDPSFADVSSGAAERPTPGAEAQETP